MSWQPWPKTDDRGLARYVLPEAATRLPIPALPGRMPQDPASRLALVDAIYTALSGRGVTYRPEDYQPDLARQSIRHPDTILDGPKVGTCLDLAVLFCGICLWHDLLPLLVVLDDHAFAAVSLRHNRRDWDSRTRMERALFADGVLRGDGPGSAAGFVDLLDEAAGRFVPIECTGFSRAVDLSEAAPEGRGRQDGWLPFARAVAAAREHLVASTRRLLFVIDVAALHYNGYQPPPPWGEAPARVQVYTGASTQRVDYRREVTDIIQYYTARFVGREAETQAVFDFSGRTGPHADRSYLLIEAPGGLGKSALMVHLLARATTGQWGGRSPHVVFFFVRRQGGRNTTEAFLRALNSQLLTHLGVSGGTPLALVDLKAQFTELWGAIEEAATPETPLLLLIDGLDEMAPAGGEGKETIADVLPAPTNPAIRVVVSSRPQPSARELVRREHPLRSGGVLALTNLDLHGVALLLESMRASAQAARGQTPAIAPEAVPSLSARVFALTRGEPLFSRAVCEQLARLGAGAMTTLERNPPHDAEGFYRQEIAALRDSDVSEEAWDILGLLAVAVGPLSREELAGISQKPPRRVSKALTAVMRYLLGERRYELMHPRLRDLLTGEFSAAERADYTRRLLEWCARFRDGGWPEDTPEYLLDYYAAQLATAGDTAGLFGLIDRRWMARQRHRDGKGELVAFIRDVSRATVAATQDTSRDWLAAFRGTYVLATVRSLASSLPPKLIAYLARAGDTAEALSYAEFVEDPVQRGEVFARLAAVSQSRGDDRETRRLVSEALAALTGPRELLGELDDAYEPLCEVLVALRDLDGLAVAQATAEQMSMDDWRAAALAFVASAYSRLSLPDRARALVLAYPGVDLFLDRALAVAAELKDDTLLRALSDVEPPEPDAASIARRAAACHLLGDAARADTLAAQAIDVARARRHVFVWASLLSSFQRGGMVARVEEVRPLLSERAVRAAGQQKDQALVDAIAALTLVGDAAGLVSLRAAMGAWREESVLSALAGSFARVGDPVRAREAVDALKSEDSDESFEARAWLAIVEGLRAAGLTDDARTAALDNRYDTRVKGLAVVVDAMAARGDDPATVMAVARRAMAEASGLTGEFGQAEAYAELACLLAERGERERAQRILDRAEAEVATIPQGGMVLGTSRALAFAHARLGAVDRAAERLSSWRDNAYVMRTLLDHMRAHGPSAASDTLEAELRALIAGATDHQTLLAAADMARAAGHTEQMQGLLARARAAAEDDTLTAFRNLCVVTKATAEAGEVAAARQVLDGLRRADEWDPLFNASLEALTRPPADDESEEEHEGEADSVSVNVSDAVALGEALEAVGDGDAARTIFDRAVAWAMTGEDFWLGAGEIAAFVRHFARTGRLADRLPDIVTSARQITHDWQKAQSLAAAAATAMTCGETAAAQTLLCRAIEYAASGGRIGFFEVLTGLDRGLVTLGVPDIEWRLYEMCEEVDAWWLPDGIPPSAPALRGG